MLKHKSLCRSGFVLALLACLLALPGMAKAAIFNIANGDVAGPSGLIAAINSANGAAGADTINLAVGGLYLLTTVNNTSMANGATGLPIITSNITINGNEATIQRDPDFPCDLDQVTEAGEFRIILLKGSSANLTLNKVLIIGGCADGTTATLPGAGGGIANDGGTLTLNSSSIAFNLATDGGGIRSVGTMLLNKSTVAFNGANNAGGGLLFATTGSTIIVNSTISGNESINVGGGIFGIFSASITNSTIAFNEALNAGGGISGSSFTANIKNSLVVGNASEVADNCHTALGTVFNSIGGNFSSDTSCPFSVTNYNPALLDILEDNGAFTAPTHALLNPGSNPAVDAISVANCTEISSGNPITEDERGEVRPLDGDLNGSDLCDAGAYEVARCGDGSISFIEGEECDDGNTMSGDGCSATCEIDVACGDGAINQAGEECDDGNTTSGDGCSATCQDECETPATDCPAAATCKDAVCNATAGGGAICGIANEPNGNTCTDNNACTQNDTCQAGACVSGAPLNCADTNNCTVDACNPNTGCTHTALTCNGLPATICGTNGPDSLVVLISPSVVHGSGGNDNITALSSLLLGTTGSVMCGGDGNDVIIGSLGGDIIFGDAGNDQIDASWGNDSINGGTGTDVCLGGLGTDIGINCEPFVQ